MVAPTADVGPGSRGAAADDLPDFEALKEEPMADAGPGLRETTRDDPALLVFGRFKVPPMADAGPGSRGATVFDDLDDLPESAIADPGPESDPAPAGV